jgi:hypothetical protein
MDLSELQSKRINIWLDQAESSNMGIKDVVALDEMLTNIVENIDYSENNSYFPRILNV